VDLVSPLCLGNIVNNLVVVSRQSSTIRRRNAIGAHGGSYSVYHALAIATKQLPPTFTPNYAFTQPPVNIGPFPQWGEPGKIVSMDPWGHITASVFDKV
jgi:hypothetical protein